MAATSVWKEASSFTFTFNGTSLNVLSCEISRTHEKFDATSNLSAGHAEHGVAVRETMVRYSFLVDTGAVHVPTERDLVDAVFNDGLHSFTGKARILTESRKGAGRGGYVIDHSAEFTGTVTRA